MAYPIPKDALDDRFAIVGTAGSGKTYLALGAVEHLLARKSRVILVDPLGVAWGLRLCADGKTPSPFQPVIFGGPHGDLPITEYAGAIIGEAVATSRDSCIVDLSALGTKAAERRFMLAFLTALYRCTDKEPVHLIIDEADMFAPQRLMDKDGDAAKLLGMMETIVRRGRAKGFVPWLLTQRPAVLSKDVLSQADGLVALKLTSSQDRDAIGAWIEGQGDKAQGKAMLASLPAKQRGSGVLWIPGRGILADVDFPAKATFDSSRTPKRGEKRQDTTLKPIDLGALKDKLAKVETDAKANDPAALKAEVRRLTTELAKASQQTSQPVEKINTAAIEAEIARARTQLQERVTAFQAAVADAEHAVMAMLPEIRQAVTNAESVITDHLRNLKKALPAATVENIAKYSKAIPMKAPVAQRQEPTAHNGLVPGSNPGGRTTNAAVGDGLSRPQAKILESLMWWHAMGRDTPTRVQVGIKAKMKARGGHFKTRVSELSGMGMVAYDGADRMHITQEGKVAAPQPSLQESVVESIRPLLSAPQCKIFDALLAGHTSRSDIAADANMDANGGHFKTRLSELSSMGIVDYPDKSSAVLQDWVKQ